MNKTIGYTAGVFDLFHIGHLNLLKKAKENCDFLIVGVNSDNLVKQYKNKTPIISEEERLEIIGSLKFVDKVVLVETRDKLDAYKKHKFNRIFVGDDWKNHPSYLEAEKLLKPYDVEFMFFPYTQGTSSTLIKKVLLDLYNQE